MENKNIHNNKQYDIFGIGNPLIDILVDVDNTFLKKYALDKGQFNLVSLEKINEILKDIKNLEIVQAPGDSTANTLAGICDFGGSAIFTGKVGDDEHGKYYNIKLNEKNIFSKIKLADLPTGKVVCLITPDLQRTFATFLGAALTLKKEDLATDDIQKCKIIHLTGYQLEDPNLRETSMHLISVAKENNKLVSIDLADPGLVERNKDFLLTVIKNSADIIFANAKEAKALTGKDPEDALSELSKYCSTAIVKTGKEGSLISHDGIIYMIDGVKVNAIDTTGAGDMYAAGILFGLTSGIEMQKAGNLASYSAAMVVSNKGARLSKSMAEAIKFKFDL